MKESAPAVASLSRGIVSVVVPAAAMPMAADVIVLMSKVKPAAKVRLQLPVAANALIQYGTNALMH
ncbi:hypothetical protein [Shewanella sp. UCD-KL12]|uniref:hypothetical protein n=1 Tax=Shewanella sp. UCD-KL12 TaxID=1917163 RepID=UPI0015C2F3ED|nr:hypothetical protein [Shewanella sp. UCD-KL12]